MLDFKELEVVDRIPSLFDSLRFESLLLEASQSHSLSVRTTNHEDCLVVSYWNDKRSTMFSGVFGRVQKRPLTCSMMVK